MRTLALCGAALLCASTALAAEPTKTASEKPAPHPARLAVPEATGTQPAAFSVEMHMKDENGKDFVMTRTVDGDNNRMDMAMDGHKMTVISLGDAAKTTYMVDDEHKMVMKMSAAKQMEEARKHQKKTDEEPPAEAQQPQGQIEALGHEKVNDRLANKFKVNYGDQGDGLMWMDAENNLPIRMESQGKTIDFTNYQFGPQPAEKFAPPKGYEVQDMDEMMAKMRGMGGMGGMAKGMAGGMIGGMAGNMGGGLGSALGGALGGPIGSMVGQYVGSKIGQKLGNKAANAVVGH